jgi:dephospho-CoA kinase
MLRVGLTGGLGSGKTTVSSIFATLGAAVISADQLGRQLMQPGQPVFTTIVKTFGPAVVREDGSLDRGALARLAFQHNRADDLNRIVHPAVIAAEEAWMAEVFAADPTRVAIVESALIFEVERWGTAPGWLQRFDKLILVTAPDEVKIARFLARSGNHAGAEADARARLAMQIPDAEKIAHCNHVLDNSGSLDQTRAAVEVIYRDLQRLARAGHPENDVMDASSL